MKLSIFRRFFLKTKLPYLKDIEGFLSQNEAYVLYKIASTLQPNSIVIEIGSWKGKSTYCIAKGLNRSSRIFAVDPFDTSGDIDAKKEYDKNKGTLSLIFQFWNNMIKHHVTNKVIPCIGFANEFNDFLPSANFIFIDGDHSIDGCENDFLLYRDKLTGEKLLAFHDYYPSRKDLGPTYVIDKYLLNNEDWEVVTIQDTIAVFRKKA
jgi:hypothetical protein